jgi:hypothetical protein
LYVDVLLEKLDRFLVRTHWESKYPLYFVKSLPIFVSKHVHLVTDFCLNKLKITRPFKFELCWFYAKFKRNGKESLVLRF